eukprot:CAMPEP_0194113000 /NCGR_PEP_ID=MMETSP0150-20130528/14651_1 /TAXON_ID=122233 /ORGANISM="Chaetoceros debilis, Strain MM31A-1" /LENGTH=30 /DNA_ID= /DNA_START= /DNA_END= /DNA_ORIENTATION=
MQKCTLLDVKAAMKTDDDEEDYEEQESDEK